MSEKDFLYLNDDKGIKIPNLGRTNKKDEARSILREYLKLINDLIPVDATNKDIYDDFWMKDIFILNKIAYQIIEEITDKTGSPQGILSLFEEEEASEIQFNLYLVSGADDNLLYFLDFFKEYYQKNWQKAIKR